MITASQLEAIAQRGMEEVFARAPRSREFHAGTWIERRYYIRYLIEAAKRIPLMNTTDAYALFRHGEREPALAAKIARYLSEEYAHESMFERDVATFGVTREECNRTPILPATEALIGYLRVAIDRDGFIPSTIWNWFVEWYAERFGPVIVQLATEAFSEERVRGLSGHLAFDDGHGHRDLMLQLVCKAVERSGSDEVALQHLRHCTSFVADFFSDLHRVTHHDVDDAST